MSTENVSAEQLRLYIERIERLMEDARGVADDIKDVFAEAKGTGFDTKTMRALIKLRAMDGAAREEQYALLDTYRAALGLGEGHDPVTAARDAHAERVEAALLAALRATGPVTIVALKKAIKDKAATALGYDALTVHLGQMIEGGQVRARAGRHADFPEYEAV